MSNSASTEAFGASDDICSFVNIYGDESNQFPCPGSTNFVFIPALNCDLYEGFDLGGLFSNTRPYFQVASVPSLEDVIIALVGRTTTRPMLLSGA